MGCFLNLLNLDARQDNKKAGFCRPFVSLEITF